MEAQSICVADTFIATACAVILACYLRCLLRTAVATALVIAQAEVLARVDVLEPLAVIHEGAGVIRQKEAFRHALQYRLLPEQLPLHQSGSFLLS